jgi:hypothetical protein
MLSKKEKLIASLQHLHITRLNGLVRQVKAMNFSKERDINATLTRLIYLKVLMSYPYIMDRNYEPSKPLRSFCLHEVKAIRSKSHS